MASEGKKNEHAILSKIESTHCNQEDAKKGEPEEFICIQTEEGFIAVDDKSKIPAIMTDLVMKGKKNFEIMTFLSKDHFEAQKNTMVSAKVVTPCKASMEK